MTIVLLCVGLMLPMAAVARDQENTGGFQIRHTLNELLGEESAMRHQEVIAPGEPISWEVYLPSNDSTEPPGVLVYVSPERSGQMDYRWRQVLDQHNLIYISANNSGNRKPVKLRVLLAIMALKALEKEFSYAGERIIISGFSGGGRVASYIASQFPGLFTGAIYICGVDFWKKEYSPKVDRLLQNRFVFLTGSKDFNLNETRIAYRRYVEAGAIHSKLMVIPGMSHEKPDKQALNEALAFLSGVESAE